MGRKQPPSPKGNPILGHTLFLASAKDQLAFLLSLRELGDISSFRVGLKTFLFVNSPDYFQQIFTNQKFVRTPLSRKLMGSFLGDGVFSQEGALHLQQRRLMQPAFHKERMRAYAEIMVGETLALRGAFRDGQVRNVIDDMMRLTLDIVSKSLFGASQRADATRIAEALAFIQDAVNVDYKRYVLLPDWVKVRWYGKRLRAVETLEKVTRRIVEERRGDEGDQGDLMSMLLTARDEDGSQMTDEQVAAQVLSMLFAGHETTANGLCWTWHLLSKNPEARAKLCAELDAVLHGSPPTIDDLPRLKYTEMVVKESLRLYPSAWYAERTPTEDVQLGEYTIKANTPVVISVFVTHRDPRFFDDPESFKPERFSEENIGKIPRYAYLPFGAGAHQCMGNAFAMMEMRLSLATLCQRYELDAAPEYVPEPTAFVTMGIGNGLKLRVAERR